MNIKRYDFIGDDDRRYEGTESENGDYIFVYDMKEFVADIVKASIADYNEFQSLSDYAEMAEEQIEELVDMLEKSIKTLEMISDSGVLGFGFKTEEGRELLDQHR